MNRSDYFEITHAEGIATIWLNNQIDGINIVSPSLIDLMESVFDEILNDSNVQAVVLASKKKDFIAGADIKAFEIEKEGEFRPFQARGHQILDRLEANPKPVVAAIHGSCYGLGAEIALACHARIASNSPSTKIALPEVKLGILPGGGGTQRLPRLVGIQKALDMMLTGKNIFAYQARKMGLVDEVTDANKLHHAATVVAQNLLKGKKPGRKRKVPMAEKLLEGNPVGRNILFKQARKMANKQARDNYPAIPAIIDCVETGMNKGLKAGLEKELELFEKLLLSPESGGLRNLFYIMTDNKKREQPEKPLQTLGMIGAGFMGSGITEVSIKNNIDVYLKDLNMDSISATQKAIHKGLRKKIKYKTMRKVEVEQMLSRIYPRTSYDDFNHADIVIEAVVEKMEVKKKIIEEIQANCREDVVIATNTSALSVTEMAEHASRPEQVIGMHYFSPVPKMPLLEIVKTPHTSTEVIKACYDFGVRQGKTVIVVNDCPGFYVNRILSPYLNECMLMVDEGASIESVNRAMENLGFPVGPFKLLDEVGLDVAAHVAETAKAATADRAGYPVCDAVTQMHAQGLLGKKGKQGFFSYNEKGKRTGVNKAAYQFFKGNGSMTMDAKEMQDRALFVMLNEARMCLDEGIIPDEVTGNTGAVFGIGFLPFTGGPFRYMENYGEEALRSRFAELASKFGARFEMIALQKEAALS